MDFFRSFGGPFGRALLVYRCLKALNPEARRPLIAASSSSNPRTNTAALSYEGCVLMHTEMGTINPSPSRGNPRPRGRTPAPEPSSEMHAYMDP